MRWTVLGSGSPEACARRASPGHLLEAGGERVLFDCGGGVFDRLLQAGLGPGDVGTVVFSHLHSDHMMDYARLAHAAWDEGAPPLKVFGPPPIAEITRRLFGPDGAFAFDLRARTGLPASQEVWRARGGTLPRPWLAPEVTEISPGGGLQRQGWRLDSAEAPHAQPFLTCMGFAASDGISKIVYSGDSGICRGMETLCEDADLLVHWCYRLDGDDASPEMRALTPTPSEIAAMAARAGVKRLTLTHFRVRMDSPELRADALARMAEVFDGPVEIAEDLSSYEV